MPAYTDSPDGAVASRASQDSLSSVSTTSLIFDRLQEETEKAQHTRESRNKKKRAIADADSDVTLKEEEDDLNDDVETGPFLGHRDSAPEPKRPERGLRRVCLILFGVCAVLWAITAVVFLAMGTYKHESDTEHDPNANHRGSGKAVTLDQVLSRFWSPKVHTISWISSPDGQDGLLLETGASGKDYLVVEDVRSVEGDATVKDDDAKIFKSQTLMKTAFFEFEGQQLQSSWVEPSPDLKKVLIGINRVSNWRYSFTATYFVYDVETGSAEPLIPADKEAKVQLAGWSPKSDAVSFTLNNNLYIRHLGAGQLITQITKDGGPEYFYGIPDWVYEEEVFAGRSATWWSDNGQYIAFLRTNETGVPEFPIQYFVSRPSGNVPADGEEPYPDVTKLKYPKAGSHNPVVDIQFFDVAKGDVFSVDIDGQFADDDRIINSLTWAGDKALVKQTNRVSDILKTTLLDIAARDGKTISTVNIGEIDGGWFEISHQLTYIPADAKNSRPQDGYVDTVIRDGRDHLAYFTPLDNPEPVMLTSGDWEVDEAPSAVDLVNNLVYFVGTKESSIQRHVYYVKLDGSGLQPLTNTSSEAYYTASFSSGAGFALLSNRGPRIPSQKVISTPSTKVKYQNLIEDNAALADKAKKHELPILKYGALDLDNGVKVNYVERRPPHFNPKKKYPVLFQQYSGPGSQSVTKKFSVDFQSYVAAGLGYLVITVDPRGTGFLGRKHRVAVRNQLGVLEAEDHIAAARHFASLDYVDESRLAIWGWSYGGFQTLKTLEQDAGRTYSYGLAVAPVTDWRFYDSIYTNRYMRTPQDNEDGYDASSIANATALGQSKRFLIMHGTGDDNVHFQNSLTLLDKLDLAGVDNYDVHVFPDSDHSIFFHNANHVVYSKLNKWLINAFNGEWLKTADPKPNAVAKRRMGSDNTDK